LQTPYAQNIAFKGLSQLIRDRVEEVNLTYSNYKLRGMVTMPSCEKFYPYSNQRVRQK